MSVGNDRAWCCQWGLFGSLFQVNLLCLVIMSKVILAQSYKSYFSFFGMMMVMRTEEKDGLLNSLQMISWLLRDTPTGAGFYNN